MDKIQKQRSSIVLYREKVNGERYIRIKYANNPAIALLLSQELALAICILYNHIVVQSNPMNVSHNGAKRIAIAQRMVKRVHPRKRS